ncbi:MAG: metallopeptidase TldD-related protein [Acidobacteriota bacterium]|nr:metallopeptidase TldD-related protein [Acidobacteriota bacterium]
MKRFWTVLAVIALLVTTVCISRPLHAAEASPVLAAMSAELERSLRILEGEENPPYFLSYEIAEIHSVSMAASFGKTVRRINERRRHLDIDVRVGSYELDNRHPRRGELRERGFSQLFTEIYVPLDDDPDAIRSVLWWHTDKKYKQAVEDLTAVRTNVQVQVEESDPSPDFSPAEPIEYIDEPAALSLDVEAWSEKLERFSAPFADHGTIYRADASLTAQARTRWLSNSDGSRLQTTRVAYRLDLSAMTKAEDGMELPRHETFFAYTPDGLPGDEAIETSVEKMIADLLALREAPVVDPYTGPAVLSGRASGVFFHEVFGHRIEGHRQKNEEEGQTFKKQVGRRILPSSFDVIFDPTRKAQGETELAGHYRFDNEGVRAQRVAVVEDGVFQGFLMSRSPIEGEAASNGHGRRQPGFEAVSRQSNLIVQVTEPQTAAELEAEFLRRLEEAGKPWGLFFEDIQGGFTLTGRTIPNTFNVIPVMVYRVFVDGRRELVRGVDLIGTPLTAFSAVVGGADRAEVFNGMCGAESGRVPVSAVSPAILISRVEVQKKDKSQDRLPILPAPPLAPGAAAPMPPSVEGKQAP